MIKNNTVLVLGAGASMPYGYPSGKGLRQMLITPSLFAPLIDRVGIKPEEIEAFCRSFMLSGMKSIDAFLAQRGDDVLVSEGLTVGEVGKHGIAIALRQNKSLDTLFHNPKSEAGSQIDLSDNWYEYLWAQLSKGVAKSNLSEFASNRLTVVTFNYDLSLEHYLFTAFVNSFGCTGSQAAELLKPIQFIHLYGQLFGNPLAAGLSYEFQLDEHWQQIRSDAKLIQVIDEERELVSSNFPSAIRAIEWASRICFLGFGFDDTNVARLDLARIFADRAEGRIASNLELPFPKVVATSLGMENAEWRAKQKLLTQKITQRIISEASWVEYRRVITNGFENYAGCKSELALRRSQILS